MSDRRSALLELSLARLREFYREPGAVFWAFGFPVVLVLALGFAFRDAEPAPLAVAVADDEPAWLLDALRAAAELDVTVVPAAEAVDRQRRGAVDLHVTARDDDDGARGVVYRFDPMQANGRLARALTDEAVQRALGRTDAVVTSLETVRERGTRYVDFLFPGILGLNLMGSSMWAIGFSVVMARKRKMLKRLAATPMRRSSFILSYFLSRLGFLVAEVALLLVFAWLVFEVTIVGSVTLLSSIALLGAASFAAIGLVIAARVQSIEAAYGWMNLVMLPMWLLSGCFFSYERFPEASHPFIQALPLTALNDALRAIMNEGAGLWDVAPEVGVLVVWMTLGFGIAARFFRWQ